MEQGVTDLATREAPRTKIRGLSKHPFLLTPPLLFPVSFFVCLARVCVWGGGWGYLEDGA